MYTERQLYYLEQLGIRPWVMITSEEPALASSCLLLHEMKAGDVLWRHLRFLLESQGYQVSEGIAVTPKAGSIFNFCQQARPETQSQVVDCPEPEQLLNSAKAKRQLMKLILPFLKPHE